MTVSELIGVRVGSEVHIHSNRNEKGIGETWYEWATGRRKLGLLVEDW